MSNWWATMRCLICATMQSCGINRWLPNTWINTLNSSLQNWGPSLNLKLRWGNTQSITTKYEAMWWYWCILIINWLCIGKLWDRRNDHLQLIMGWIRNRGMCGPAHLTRMLRLLVHAWHMKLQSSSVWCSKLCSCHPCLYPCLYHYYVLPFRLTLALSSINWISRSSRSQSWQ